MIGTQKRMTKAEVMSNIVKTLNSVSGIDGTLDVVTLDDGVNAYIINCEATTDIQFNDPADAGF